MKFWISTNCRFVETAELLKGRQLRLSTVDLWNPQCWTFSAEFGRLARTLVHQSWRSWAEERRSSESLSRSTKCSPRSTRVISCQTVNYVTLDNHSTVQHFEPHSQCCVVTCCMLRTCRCVCTKIVSQLLKLFCLEYFCHWNSSLSVLVHISRWIVFRFNYG